MPGIHKRRAASLLGLKQFQEAEEAAQLAVRLEPGDIQAHTARINTLLGSGNLIDAAECAILALRLQPNSVEIAQAIGMGLMLTGSASRAVDVLRGFLKSNPNALAIRDLLATSLAYSAPATQSERVEAAVAVARDMSLRLPQGEALPPSDPDPERPLRIGYLAQDISAKSVIARFVEALFEFHDRERYPITCYLTQPGLGPLSPRMAGHLQRWVNVDSLNDAALVSKIRSDRIDILVDLAGSTPGHRLSALMLRPAPVVAHAIGCPITSGLPCVDYRFVDSITDPPGYESHWVERLVRLPGCFLCFSPSVDSPPPRRPRPPTGPITFGSFNADQKIGQEVIALWSRVLRQVKGSRLLLKGQALSHPRIHAAYSKRFAQCGVGKDQIEIVPRTESYRDHLALYDRVDISLDPFPYNGTTTLCESMWMGVPYVTLLGDCHAGRVGASLLTAVGLPELIATNTDSYVKLAADLATDATRLSTIHASLRDRMRASVLCNGPAHARAFESALREMWRVKCAAATSG
jgi:predicted O-linked N-acetylglucosamine transferase (SPINDLY family)